jgi:hypothetical protein
MVTQYNELSYERAAHELAIHFAKELIWDDPAGEIATEELSDRFVSDYQIAYKRFLAWLQGHRDDTKFNQYVEHIIKDATPIRRYGCRIFTIYFLLPCCHVTAKGRLFPALRLLWSYLHRYTPFCSCSSDPSDCASSWSMGFPKISLRLFHSFILPLDVPASTA